MPRWSLVRLIFGKEFRDLIRDRRTVMLILVLPAVLWTLFGTVGWLFASTLLGQTTLIGVIGADHLPPGSPGGYPALLDGTTFAPGLVEDVAEGGPLKIVLLTGDAGESLRTRKADTVLVVPPGFAADLIERKRPTIRIQTRDGDDKSKLAGRRLATIVRKWEDKLVEKRLADRNVPLDEIKPLTIEDPLTDKPKARRAAEELRDAFTRIFPFLLMMWLVAGAIQPAVDMTAGERERGTMETLLISPAERSEIVLGKFLATTVFAFSSVVWNVVWLASAALIAELFLGFPIVNLPGTVGCVVLGLPLAMMFSAVCVALGIFAKSTKEGQYYLLPLIFVTMPLAFWSMTPGMELSGANCWVPVTGAMLLQQKLLSVSGEPIPWEYFGPVLGSLAVWIALALAFAIWQFTRESVLFRETGPSGGGLGRWFRRPSPREHD